MRVIVVFLAAAFLAGCSLMVGHLDQKSHKPDWVTSTDEILGYSISYPSSWSVISTAPLYLTSSLVLVHGLGVPPPPGTWININKVEGRCSKVSTYFVDSGSVSGNDGGLSFLEKNLCLDSFQITLGLWNVDPDKEEHIQLLEKIASTFRAH